MQQNLFKPEAAALRTRKENAEIIWSFALLIGLCVAIAVIMILAAKYGGDINDLKTKK